MIRHRSTFAAAFAIAAMIALTGCGMLEPTPTATPSPTPTMIDTSTYIGEIIDPAETEWFGRDSGGDDTAFTLHDDGTVAVQFGANSYDDPNDTWQVIDGVLHIEVYLDDTHGVAKYMGTWIPETSTIDMVMSTTVSDRTLTVTLAQQ